MHSGIQIALVGDYNEQQRAHQAIPRLLAAAVEKLGLRDCVARSEVFCPVNWWEWDRTIAATPPRGWEAWTTRGTCGVHLWNEIWRREGVDKNGSFPATSLYAQLQRRGLAACRT